MQTLTLDTFWLSQITVTVPAATLTTVAPAASVDVGVAVPAAASQAVAAPPAVGLAVAIPAASAESLAPVGPTVDLAVLAPSAIVTLVAPAPGLEVGMLLPLAGGGRGFVIVPPEQPRERLVAPRLRKPVDIHAISVRVPAAVLDLVMPAPSVYVAPNLDPDPEQVLAALGVIAVALELEQTRRIEDEEAAVALAFLLPV
jgi:hypothetical protein